MREHAYNFHQKHTVLSPEVVAGFDAVVLSTAHKAFDYPMIQKNAKLVIDTRGKYRGHHDNVIKA
jgi:UDP-N-acetyl-D-glucosamine dehydrogenase